VTARWLATALLLTLGVGACGRSIRHDAGEPAPSSGGTSSEDPPNTPVSACGDTPQPGPSPLRRLSSFQIENTLRDLFRDVPAVLDVVESENPFSSSYDDLLQPPAEVTLDAYHRVAHEVALAASNPVGLPGVTGCAPAADEAPCRDQFLERWLELAYRRPVSESELVEMQQVFATGRELGGDFASGVRAVVEVVLQGPDFLYLLEQGEGDAQDGVVALASYETAQRLAYFLTGSSPDAELLAAAQSGSFTEAELETHARRLLGTPGSRLVTRDFFQRLLRLDGLTAPSGEVTPSYTAEIASLTAEETGRFVEQVTFDGAGTFQALMTEPSTFLNGKLAEFYGLPGITGDTFQRVELNPAQRAGILTQSAFLTATSPGGHTRPVQRGVAILTKVLCQELPPPPPDIAVPLAPPAPDGATTREQLETAVAGAACQDCHRDIDPLGFAFENYNAVGLWRELDNGKPIDASGTLHETDAQGSFANAVELLQLIAQSDDARACFAKNWLRYGHGRELSEQDACALEQLETALRDSDGNVVELLVALAKTDQLRYRLASELGR
jgi:hypothetical protein